MGTITLSVPDELKKRMDQTDFINWSSIARSAFADALVDIDALRNMRLARGISEISESDARMVKEEVVNDAIATANKVASEIRTGKRKRMSIAEFNKWCDR